MDVLAESAPGIKKKNQAKPTRPTIRVDVPLNRTELSNGGLEYEQTVIDFIKLAQEKYGRDLYPSAVDVMNSALNDASGGGDAMAVDDDDDEEEEKEKEKEKAQEKRQKNRGRVEGKYDLEDPFIDDTEMAWEEHAASTQDGFFVYQGPLQATEPVRADGTSSAPALKADGTERKKPGPPKGYKQQRGGGPGSRGGRGGGPGSRGGRTGAARKKQNEAEKKSESGQAAGGGGGGSSGENGESAYKEYKFIAPKPMGPPSS